MKYFAALIFDNSATAQNHGVWAVEKAHSREYVFSTEVAKHFLM